MAAVNLRHETFDVDVSRRSGKLGSGPGAWGNPFVVGVHGNRGECIEPYAQLLWKLIRSGKVTVEQLAALDGKRLGCYCAPQACHADVLVRAAAWAKTQLTEEGR